MKHLRAIEPEDLDLMYIIENDLRLWRHGNTTAPYSRYALHQYLNTTQNDIYKDSQVRFAIDHCGFLDITDFAPQHHRASIGIVLCPESQGQGLATQAINEAHIYARTVGIHQLWATVATQPNNVSDKREQRKLAYSAERRKRRRSQQKKQKNKKCTSK